jgi:hypothetical protein
MFAKITELIDDTRGSFVEYIILIGVIALLGVGAYEAFGTDVSDSIKAQGDAVAGIRRTATTGTTP